MDQKYILSELLNSYSVKNSIIADLLHEHPRADRELALKRIKKVMPDIEDQISSLSRFKRKWLNTELNSADSTARLQGFETGVDFIMTLLGKPPVYDVLPEELKRSSHSRAGVIWTSNIENGSEAEGDDPVSLSSGKESEERD